MRSSRRRTSSFSRKILTSLVAVAAVVALAGGWLGTHALERQAIDHLTASLAITARLMEPDILKALAAPPDLDTIQPLVSALGKRANCRLTVIDPAGIVLGDSEQPDAAVRFMDNHRNRPEIRAAFDGRMGTSLRYSTTVKHPMLYVAMPVVALHRVMAVLRVAVPATVAVELRQQIRRTVIVSLLIGLMLAAALGAWLTQRVATPLSRLTQVAHAYATGDLTARAPAASIREVHELSEALGTMARALQAHIGELTTQRNQARAILESMAEGVIALDADGKILLGNPAAGTLFGVDVGRSTGRRLFELVRFPEMQELVRTALQHHQRMTKDLRMFHPHEKLLRVHAVPCEGCGPTGPCAVLVIQDVTEDHRYDQLRREFVANVSHELKSPLTAIRGLTETLLGGALDDPTHNRRFVQLIDEDTARLSRLIDDLLALSQIESQAVPLRLSFVALRPLVESVVTSLQPGLAQHDLTVILELSSDLVVQADADRLRQVFANLLDNAIKYNTPGGRITVSALRDGAWVKAMVADTGVGIPEKDLPRIFERFYRVDKGRSRELGGTGLGLAIVKHIVEAHGGSVSVDSRLSHGSTFFFTVPLAA